MLHTLDLLTRLPKALSSIYVSIYVLRGKAQGPALHGQQSEDPKAEEDAAEDRTIDGPGVLVHLVGVEECFHSRVLARTAVAELDDEEKVRGEFETTQVCERVGGGWWTGKERRK